MKSNNFLKKITKIHFVGIGGISQSALAKLMQSLGKKVTGSDTIKSKITKELEVLGIKIFYKHKKQNVKGVDLVVFSGAVNSNNKELQEANKNFVLCLERSEFLALVSKEYENVIAIGGTHGKTTTCVMLASIFKSANKNPTVHVGGESEITNGNMLIGSKNHFITEACEYRNSFLTLNQTVGVILNIENDHTDVFEDSSKIYNSFSRFYNNSKQLTVVNEKYISQISKNNKNYITFGLKENNNYYADSIKLTKKGSIIFRVYENSKMLGDFKINSMLKHNVENALSAIAVSRNYKIGVNKIKEGLKNFKSAKRRLEVVGRINNSIVIHDYAHHPTEIEKTIGSVKKFYKKPIICVFQPHTYTRTKSLMNDFLTSFDECEQVCIFKTYPAREKFIKKGSGKTLFKNLVLKDKKAHYFKNYARLKKHLNDLTFKENIFLVLGAGNIENFAQYFLQK